MSAAPLSYGLERAHVGVMPLRPARRRRVAPQQRERGVGELQLDQPPHGEHQAVEALAVVAASVRFLR